MHFAMLCSEILFFYNSKCNILRMPFRVFSEAAGGGGGGGRA
jgi:hypothetical protein